MVTLLSHDRKLLSEFLAQPRLTNEWMAKVLGYPQSKADALRNSLERGVQPVAVRARDSNGGYGYETIASPDAVQRAVRGARRSVPGGVVDVTTPETLIRDRASRT